MNRVQVTTSWDDGHVLDQRVASLMRDHGIVGTFYIAPENRELPRHERLSDDEVAALSREFEIGAHTMTHPHLTDVPLDSASQEIEHSKEYLERLTRAPIQSFCYPAGYTNEAIAQRVARAGFTTARTVRRFAYATNDRFMMDTTVHAYRHWSDAHAIARAVGIRSASRCLLHWDDLAIELFEHARRVGGFFHLWGHSWEIDAAADWQRLERVFRHIGRHPHADYRVNSAIV